MYRLISFSSLLALLVLALSCIRIENAFPGLPPGPWRGELNLTDAPKITRELEEDVALGFEEIAAGQLPFNFEVHYQSDSSFYLELINGEERIRVEEITMGLDRSTGRDTLLIRLPGFQTYIEGEFEENEINGFFVDPTREGEYRIPLRARFGQDHRFTRLRKPPALDLSGKWAVEFEIESDKPFPAIGHFRQEGNELRGTFLTETGDYRYLEGTVQADKFYLSTFDGAHAFLFEGKIERDSTLIGTFRSGTHYLALWRARRDRSASLSGLTERVQVVDPAPLQLKLRDLEGEPYPFSERKAPLKIVQLMGTWCPNCKDQTVFLKDYLREHPELAAGVVALAFERKSREEAMPNLRTYARRMDLPYPVLYAGGASKREAQALFPMLSDIQAWPTLLILDGNNRIRKVYSGFDGPATPGFSAFKEDFQDITDQLLAEAARK